MCGLCGALGVDHWAEAGGDRRARVFRVALLRRVLVPFGLSLDEWGGSVYLLRDAKGATEVVEGLGGVWQAAERLAGRPLDPLDPVLLRALSGDG
jgi:hypothetical protein